VKGGLAAGGRGGLTGCVPGVSARAAADQEELGAGGRAGGRAALEGRVRACTGWLERRLRRCASQGSAAPAARSWWWLPGWRRACAWAS
jgi:hypothetical protein